MNIAQYTYDYDLAGNRTDMVDMSNNTTYYLYDSLNRLTTERRDGANAYTRRYSYDSVGNRLTMNNGGTVTSYSYNNLNQLTSDGTNSYSYDNNGNLTNNGNTWDYENEMTYRLAVNSDQNVTYTYDALGKRVELELYDEDFGNSYFTQYFFDGINPLLEKQNDDNSHPTLTTSAVYTLAPGVIKEIISIHTTNYITGVSGDLFYHYDPIGNVLFVSDTSGNINTSYVQEGFGNVIAQSGSASNNYHLTTKETDSNTGLYYFYARWYDPSVGRFISKDPLLSSSYYIVPSFNKINPPARGKCGYSNGLQGPQGLNPYTYTANNPLNLIDPTGGCSKGGGKSPLPCPPKGLPDQDCLKNSSNPEAPTNGNMCWPCCAKEGRDVDGPEFAACFYWCCQSFDFQNCQPPGSNN